MTRKPIAIVLAVALVAAQGGALRAGGLLETIDITGNVPSPIAGHIIGRVVGIKWDVRSIPVQYRMNSTLDPIPNPVDAPLLTVPQASAALQRSLNQWNDIPTSFIEMRIVGTVANAGLVGFDMVNELSFRTAATFGAIASSPSVALIADATFVHGEDIDGDGDPDVSSATAVTADTDGDGDLEFPPGLYKAGTILDNDVQFNTKVSNGFRFTVGDAALDTNTRSVDLNTVATHEFGHSHGLSHSLENQKSDTNGDGATMFPFIDTGDPASEREQRSLGSDDIAWSSFVYPEGTAVKGPAALKKGDIPFKWLYGVIEGNVRHGVRDQPIAGANAFAVSKLTGRVVASGFSGTTQVSYNPANGGRFIVDPAFNILDGKYRIPVPLGIYGVGIEAVDGQPVPAGSISLTAQIGSAFGQLNFNEEFYNRTREEAIEVRPGESWPVTVLPGWTRSGIDLVTTESFNLNNFGTRNFVGFTGAVPGHYYAVQVPASQIAAITPGEPLLAHSVLFNTRVLDASTTPKFAEAMLTTGVVNPDGTATIDLAHPLERETRFVGQDDDFSPFFLKRPRQTGERIRDGIASGAIQNLFLVLRLPTTSPFPGVSALPPLMGLDGDPALPTANDDGPILGLSFASADGTTFTRDTRFNFMFSLVLSSVPE